MRAPRTRACARRERWLTRRSSNQRSPASACSRRPSTFRSVDLPDPDEPTMATNSPGFVSKSTPVSTGIGRPSASWYDFWSPTARTSTSRPPPRQSARPAPGNRCSRAPADGLGGRKAHDAKRRVARCERSQNQREHEGEDQQAPREEEDLLAVGLRVDDE